MVDYYTNGGELRTMLGEDYIGYYHLQGPFPFSGPFLQGDNKDSQQLSFISFESNQITDKIEIAKFKKNQFKKRYDTDFSELLNTTGEDNIFNSLADENTLDISKFFDLYNKIFYDIPKAGSVNSHETIIKQSSEYINFTPNQDLINSLQNEITSLREQLLQEQQNNNDLLSRINN